MRCCFPNRTTQKPNHSLTLLETFWKGDSSKAVPFLLNKEDFKMASFCVQIELLQSSSSNIRENEVQTSPPKIFLQQNFSSSTGVMIEFFIEYHNSNIKIRSKGKEVPPHQSEIEKKIHTNSFRDAYRSSFKYKKTRVQCLIENKDEASSTLKQPRRRSSVTGTLLFFSHKVSSFAHS